MTVRKRGRAKAKAISMRITFREWLTFRRALYEGNRHMRAVYAERAKVDAQFEQIARSSA